MRLFVTVVRWTTYLVISSAGLIIALATVGIYLEERLTGVDRLICARTTTCEDDECCMDYIGIVR